MSNKKFAEIQKKNLEILKQRVEAFSNSEESDDEFEETGKSRIEALFVNYKGDDNQTRKLCDILENGENTDCLICIKQVRTKDPIWSCRKCFVAFHLVCIQRWANDSVIQRKIAQENQPEFYYTSDGTYVPKKLIPIHWDCPNCRNIYNTDEVPRHYECFCGKERDPPVQPFLFPHSCGETCLKPLEPDCGHRCLLLCHPFSHPPCAQIIQKSCGCGKSPLRTIRCSQRSWSCGKKCGKLLTCNIHVCESECHESECPPCKKSRDLSCMCGKSKQKIKCEKPFWRCDTKCGKKFSCGVHFCEEKCHSGSCGECPFKLNQTCFCGKQTKISDNCTDFAKESCGSTCLKPLSCGNPDHKCLSRCHKGDCGTCIESVVKKCRCGSISKESQCSKELLCETKCKNMKNCRKHNCNRKCCNGCLPCDKVCPKTLSCGKHKCGALCHDGVCYPCIKKSVSKCRCGATSLSINCGRKTRAPKCKKPCPINTKCHHDPVEHRCHFGDCPNCNQICSEPLPCSHKCLALCHDNVKIITKDKNFVPKVPGEYAEEKIEVKKLPHPPCKTLVKIICFGGHEEIEMECNQARTISCEKRCNRHLNCENHFCSLLCHKVADISSQEQDENCEECQAPCTKERICSHPCSKNQCHPGQCRKCQATVKVKCYCGLNDMLFRCCDVYKRRFSPEEIEQAKEKHMQCGGKCPKNLSCGHSCISNCHKGPCPGAETCKKKVRIFCKCKQRKTDYTCDSVQAGKISILPCDESCELKKKQEQEEKQKEKQRLEEIEREKNQKELELFEKKFGPKKFKERKSRNLEPETKQMNIKIIAGISGLIVVLGVILYFVLVEN